MGWIVFGVWLVWDMAAKACGRSHSRLLQTLPKSAVARVESRGVMSFGRCYRCSTCGTCWPFHPAYTKCAKCDSKCWSKLTEADDDVLTNEEATKLKAYIEFGEFCALRDERIAQEEIDRLFSDLPLFPDAFV